MVVISDVRFNPLQASDGYVYIVLISIIKIFHSNKYKMVYVPLTL